MIPNPPRIVLLGSGGVAEALCRVVPVAQVFARNGQRGRALADLAGCGWENRPDRLAAADLYLIAVSDVAIGPLSEALDFQGALVAHTAASVAWEEFSARIARRGVFYPLQTFTPGRVVDLSEVPIFIEAENEADAALLEALARTLSNSVHRSDAAMRRRIHLGAVFASNFVNGMYAAAEEWMSDNGLDFNLLKPLIAETARKTLDAPSPRAVQTGPAVRGDRTTIERHLRLLEDRPEIRTIYEEISRYLFQLHTPDGQF